MPEALILGPGGATETTLAAILTELGQKLETGQAVALDGPTLAALEQVTATLSGPVALDAATLAALETVGLDAATLAALESITASVTGTVAVSNLPATQQVTGTVALDPATLAALETVSAAVTGTVALDPATLAALESVTATVTGTVAVTGTQQDALTAAELRAADVNIADSGEREYTHVVATVTTAGVTTIHTPAPGKAVRLRWIYAVNLPTAETAPLIDVALGATPIYRAYALSKRQRVTGPTNGALTIELSTTGAVAVTAILEEVTL